MPREAALVKTDYLVNYLGVFLGLMVATITFLHGVSDKLFDKLVADYQHFRDRDRDKATRIKSIIRDIESLFKGLKSVTLWLFSSLIVVLAIGLLEAFNPPQYIVSWPLPWSFSVQQSFMSVKCAAFFFSLLVMLMVILNLFQIISASARARADVLE